MDLANPTRNQHYISQAEQRLNAINPSAKKRNQRIFAFEAVERSPPSIQLVNPGGIKIENNLSFLDLFSFQASPDARKNLEVFFGECESRIATSTRDFVDKVRAGRSDVKKEFCDIFESKWLNFLRNPFCVQKMLNTFGEATNYEPTSPSLVRAYNDVLAGSKPQMQTVVAEFGLTPELYRNWLRALFVLLAPYQTASAFQRVLADLLERHFVAAHVFDFADGADDDVCLLSDRGMNIAETDEQLTFECNLNWRTFLIITLVRPPQPHLARVHIEHHKDDRARLAEYNQRTVYQCAHRVFAARSTPLLALPPD